MASYDNNINIDNGKSKILLPKPIADYYSDKYRKLYGVDIIWVDSQDRENKSGFAYPTYKEYRDNGVPIKVYERWKAEGMFRKGMARLVGPVRYRSDLDSRDEVYWFYAEADNDLGIKILLKSFSAAMNKEYNTKEDLAKDFEVDIRPNAQDRMHVGGYTKSLLSGFIEHYRVENRAFIKEFYCDKCVGIKS